MNPTDRSAFVDLDTEVGLRHCGGKSGLYLRLLDLFRSDPLPGFEPQWKAARLAGDERATRRLVHTFKGVCLSVGALPLGEAARALERALHQEDEAAIERALVGVLARIGPLQGVIDDTCLRLAAPAADRASSALPKEAA